MTMKRRHLSTLLLTGLLVIAPMGVSTVAAAAQDVGSATVVSKSGTPEAMETQLDKLRYHHARYRETAERIARLDARQLEAYFTLLARLRELEAKIQALEDALLAAADTRETGALPPFEIRLALGQVDGPDLTAPVGDGDILAFSARVTHPDFGSEPRATGILWQVFAPDGEPLDGAEKRQDTLESGVTRTYSFRIQLNRPRQGRHTVRAVHYLLEDPTVGVQAEAGFDVHDPLLIKDIVVTNRPGGGTHQAVLGREDAPHVYVHYTLHDDIPTVEARLRVSDAGTGEVIAESSAQRPREKDYFGIRIEADRFRPNQKMAVLATITTPKGTQRTLESGFAIEPDNRIHPATITVPSRVDAGTTSRFAVEVPSEFRRPIKAVYEGHGLALSHNGGLHGTVRGTATKTLNTHLRVIVTDADGRRAKGSANITVVAKRVAPALSTRPSPKRQAAPPVASRPATQSPAPRSEPDPWKAFGDQLRKGQDELNRLKAQQQREMREFEARQQQQRQSSAPGRSTPAWMSGGNQGRASSSNRSAEQACYAATRTCLAPCNQMVERIRQMCAAGDSRPQCKQYARQATQCSDACARKQTACLANAGG